MRQPDGTQYKYICCKGACPSAPSSFPQPKDPESKTEWVQGLIDIVKDPYDMTDLSAAQPGIVKKLRALLPADYAAGCGTLRDHSSSTA